MNGIDLGQKLGPLPLGGWLAAAGVVGGYLWINRGSSDAPALVPVAERGVGEGGGQFISDPPQTGTPAGTGGESNSNAVWGQRALNWLIQQGHDPGKSDNAVRKYLHADPLTVQEQALINLALLQFGTPPDSLTPVENLPGEPQGTPHIQLVAEPSSIPDGGTMHLVGRVSYGGTGHDPDGSGQAPDGPQMVTITIYNSQYPTRVLSRYFTMTDENGNFRTRPGWTSPVGNQRRYRASWKGAIKSVYVKINK